MPPVDKPSRKPSATEQITQFARGETLQIGRCNLNFVRRRSRRLIVGFFEAGDNALWLDEPCSEAGFSQIRIQAQAEGDFRKKNLGAFIKKLGASELVNDFQSISLCGAGTGGEEALCCSGAFRSPVIVAFNPTTDRKNPPPNQVQATYVFYDPFGADMKSKTARFRSAPIHWLKCFGLQEGCLNALWRMKVLPPLLQAALRDELDPGLFYSLIRRRKDYSFYRKGMEAALEFRGQIERRSRFRAAFQARRERASPKAQFEALKDHAAENRPKGPGSWVRAGSSENEMPWPSAGGNIWMLDHGRGRMCYMSDRWQNITMGYEERDGITLAQSPPVAVGIVGFGQGVQVERPLSRRFHWHVTDETLDGSGPAFGPLAEATILSELQHAKSQTLHSLLAISQPQAGTVAQDTLPDSVPYKTLLARVKKGCRVLQDWDKSLFIDRVRLSLLAGSPQMTQYDAAAHYAETAKRLAHDLTVITGQSAPPLIVVTQGAGFRHNGRSENILAEGRFDLENPTLSAIVSTPAYPWELMEGTRASPSPKAALIMDELSALAVAERQCNRPWHCPAMQLAMISGRVVKVHFSSLDGLHLIEGRPHGFRLESAEPAPRIVAVEVVSDNQVRLELDAESVGKGVQLAYAWGHETTNPNEGYSANHGALRDGWSQPSIAVPGQTLYRYALSGRVPLIRRDCYD